MSFFTFNVLCELVKGWTLSCMLDFNYTSLTF